MTSWRAAVRTDLDSVLSFLLRDESLCVPFTARLRTGARGQTVYIGSDEKGCVTGSRPPHRLGTPSPAHG